MEALVEFYMNELSNNPELSREDRDKYLDVINSYTRAVLQRLLNRDKS